MEEHRVGIGEDIARHDGKRCGRLLRRWWTWCTAVILGVIVVAMTAGARETADRIVAYVNDDIIVLSELNDELAPFAERVQQTDYDQDKKNEMLFKLREDMLNRLVEQKLTDQEIKKAGINISEEEIDQGVERLKQANRMTEEMLTEALKNEGMTLDEYRGRIKEQMLRSRLVTREVNSKIVVTDEDIKSYYDTHPDEFRGEAVVHLRHLTFSLDETKNQLQKDEARREMTALLQEIESGADFQQIESRFNNPAAGKRAGDLGEFRAGSLSPVLQAAISKINAGDVTELLETDQGLQIFYLQKNVTAGGKTLEEASAAISEKIYKQRVDEKFTRWLEDLKKTSLIKLVL